MRSGGHQDWRSDRLMKRRKKEMQEAVQEWNNGWMDGTQSTDWRNVTRSEDKARVEEADGRGGLGEGEKIR